MLSCKWSLRPRDTAFNRHPGEISIFNSMHTLVGRTLARVPLFDYLHALALCTLCTNSKIYVRMSNIEIYSHFQINEITWNELWINVNETKCIACMRVCKCKAHIAARPSIHQYHNSTVVDNKQKQHTFSLSEFCVSIIIIYLWASEAVFEPVANTRC